MNVCKWCGLKIRFETSSIDDYWCHVETNLIWCQEEHYTYAEPYD